MSTRPELTTQEDELSEDERPAKKSRQKKTRADAEHGSQVGFLVITMDNADRQEGDSGDEGPARKKSRKRQGAAVKKATAPRKRKAPAAAAAEEQSSQMKTDCPLFSMCPHDRSRLFVKLTLDALISPDIALLPLVEEWVETYQQTADDENSETAAVHELIQFFIRCCGLNADVEEHETLDVDGVVDAIERIQDESMLVSTMILNQAIGLMADKHGHVPSCCSDERGESYSNKSQPVHPSSDQDAFSHAAIL